MLPGPRISIECRPALAEAYYVSADGEAVADAKLLENFRRCFSYMIQLASQQVLRLGAKNKIVNYLFSRALPTGAKAGPTLSATPTDSSGLAGSPCRRPRLIGIYPIGGCYRLLPNDRRPGDGIRVPITEGYE